MLNRRTVTFEDMDEVLSDVRQLAESDVSVIGNHSFAQIVRHLALTNDVVTGKIEPPALPWYMRLAMPLMRGRILNRPAQPGFKLPSNMQSFFWPNSPITLEAAIKHLADSIENYNRNGPLTVHPVFGPATREQVNNVTLSHAAMHLSFVRPLEGETSEYR